MAFLIAQVPCAADSKNDFRARHAAGMRAGGADYRIDSRSRLIAALFPAIAPQPLAQALSAFAKETGLQLVYVSELATNAGVKGSTGR